MEIKELLDYLITNHGIKVSGLNQHGYGLLIPDCQAVHCRVMSDGKTVTAAMQKKVEGSKIITVRIEIAKNPEISEQARIVLKHANAIEKGTDVATLLEAKPAGSA